MGFRHSIQAIIALAFAFGCNAQTQDAGAPSPRAAAPSSGIIQRLPLNEFATYEIGISPDVPTSIMLPSAPKAFDGVGFTTSAGVAAPVYLQHTAGSSWFSVRALFPEASANLNVIIDGKVYSFHFFITANPHRALTIFDPNAKRKAAPKKRPSSVSVARLLQILDDAKTFHLVEEQYPNLYREIEHRAALENEVSPYGSFTVLTDQVYRFPKDDTIVFRIILVNHTPNPIHYDPRRVGVRVSNTAYVYWKSISDLSGVIPAATEITTPTGTTVNQPGQSWGYFAITGNPDGSRANVSVRNRFDILIQRQDAALGAPLAPSPSPQEEGNPPAALSDGALRAQPYGLGSADPLRSAPPPNSSS